MMQSGKYWIGDLCYVMNDHWDEVCQLTIRGHDVKDGEFILSNGVRFACYSTYYGDGEYSDNNGNLYGVDAGLIGCIRLEDIHDVDSDIDSGHVFTFETEFKTKEDNDLINFGHINIETKDNEYDIDEVKEEED